MQFIRQFHYSYVTVAVSGASGQKDGEGAALTRNAFDLQSPTMTQNDVLDDREPEPRAAVTPRAMRIDAIEPFR